ncbi:HlyD family efflux transporter periplasmic adaptor subunit [Patescibacteria group bacterium]|nr:HlyD family efflux transporter periplasmic adaptor subunit [Patescibacteria group bacterium]
MTKKIKKIIILSFVLLIILFGIFIYNKNTSQIDISKYDFIAVGKGDILQQVNVVGKVVPREKVDLGFEKTGKISKININIGDKAIKGDVLIKLDDSDLVSQLSEATAGVNSAQAQLNQYKAALNSEQAKLAELKQGAREEEIQLATTAVSNAVKNLGNVRIDLANVKQKADSDMSSLYDEIQDILNNAYAKADDAINKQVDDFFINDLSDNPELSFLITNSQIKINAENGRENVGNTVNQIVDQVNNFSDEYSNTQLDTILSELENNLILVRDFLNILNDAINSALGISSTTINTYKTNLNTARTNINTVISSINSQEQLIVTQKITNQNNISTSESAVNTAENTLATVQDQLTLKKSGATKEQIENQEAKIAQAQANINNQNWQIQQAQARAENILVQIDKMSLKSPINGIIVRQEATLGEIALTNAVIVSLVSEGEFEIEANVSETEIAIIELQDETTMTLDSLGLEEKFSGKVIKIDPAETVISGVIYYKVTSVFDVKDLRIKSGMTVNLDIKTEDKQDALFLPYFVILEDNGEKYVEVLENNILKKKIIETGLEGENNIEIVSGLEYKDKIVFEK